MNQRTPSVVHAEIHCDPVPMTERKATFTANVWAMPLGVVISRVGVCPEMETEPLPAANVFDHDGNDAGATSAVAVKHQSRHVLRLTLHASTCWIDDRAGFYVVPHNHLRVERGAESIRALCGVQDEQAIAAGIRRYRDILHKQLDELNYQLEQFDNKLPQRLGAEDFARIAYAKFDEGTDGHH